MNKKNIKQNYEFAEVLLDLFLKFPKKVQQLLLVPVVENDFFPVILDDVTIKSPIEQIFITAFELYCRDKKQIYLFPQKEINVNGKKYCIDFEFDADDYLTQMLFNHQIKNTTFKLAIECDGHKFHQKTKEQVQYDNEREFDLKMAGYEVLRFSGSQIYNDPFKCAEDTYNFIMNRIEIEEEY